MSLQHTKDAICVVTYILFVIDRTIYCYNFKFNITFSKPLQYGVVEADQATNNLYYFIANKPKLYNAILEDNGEVKSK
jgi:hypothetical protein